MNELQRLIQNLIRVGVVAEVDLTRPGCRVKTGGLTTDWLPWLIARAGAERTWSAPSVGEQVLLLSIGGELSTAFVLPAIFSDAHPAPSDSADARVVVFPDGARFEYEPASGQLLITGVKNVVINAEAMAINAAVTINGPVTHNGGNMTSNGVVVHTHKHSGVLSGGSNTGGPV
ncbi:phage baseplate assembly protein V [Dickeya solani]|uniref:Phage baseplate assembly protein V n=2 Tax=Dickeya solani TaxID=1089444 RepID=A0ABU4EE76_9GAMM|nr:phage baseplate assembly protein V [Dickeya solani]MCA7001645.1 phage baseplate assembly protein V [Dickeya solani]MCZ0821069.1 phage baseplate assembly protein V [Dickeya solani]MDV6997444.1 phage baseplate assembly protein V [Dickeya solani]MDV7003058.1 phage baseplate assembly protein V [Dickeya solani]MDV7040250.1 phage baseplate assembly protein V [Dickeya solani]